jgi:hypothetical protein
MPLSYKEMSAPIVEPVSLAQAKLQCIVDAGMILDDTLIAGLIVAARQFCEKKMQRAIFPRAMRLTLDNFPFARYGDTVNANDRHCMYGKYWHALAIRLPLVATLSVQSITYVDLNGETQTVDPSTYYTDLTSEPARIAPLPGIYWPYTMTYLPGSVTILYTAATYAVPVTDALVVPAAPGPYAVTLSQAAAIAAGASLLVALPTLADSTGNPVAFTSAANVLTVAGTYAGATLTANYYLGNCPATIAQAMLLLISAWYSNRDAMASSPARAIDMGVDALLADELFETNEYQQN